MTCKNPAGTRRAAAVAGMLMLLAVGACAPSDTGDATSADASAVEASDPVDTDTGDEEFRALEEEFDARLGVYALDTGSGEEIAYQADERFAFASTFKALAVGAVLHQYGADGIHERLDLADEELVPHSPVTSYFAESGMTLRDVSAATLWYSDNTAANVLFDALDGPEGMQEVLRELGDEITRLDRREPDLNEAVPGDERDTSTPRAMAGTLQGLLLGDSLGQEERELLRLWMVTNVTGDSLIRAGTPQGWTVADKSGSAGYGGRNNIAVLWPDDGGDPLVMAVMSSRDTKDAEHRDELVARAAEAALAGLGHR